MRRRRVAGSALAEMPWTFVRGMLMGAADLVPGVSGGTIALILGYYDRLIASIRAGSVALGQTLHGQVPAARSSLSAVEWLFLAPLLLGIGAAILVLADLVETQLDEHPIEMAGLFLGFVGSGIIVAWRITGGMDGRRIAIMLITGAVVFSALGLSEGVDEDTVGQAGSPALWTFFFAGAVAICAMILPGISGSLLLIILGMYRPVLDAVTDRDVAPVLIFGAGAVLGLAVFSRVLHWVLRHHRRTVMAVLIGLMLGSVRVLWPWPHGLNGTGIAAPGDAVAATVGLAIIGVLAVFLISRVASRVDGRLAVPVANDPATTAPSDTGEEEWRRPAIDRGAAARDPAESRS